jgi:hypothetical protein
MTQVHRGCSSYDAVITHAGLRKAEATLRSVTILAVMTDLLISEDYVNDDQIRNLQYQR